VLAILCTSVAADELLDRAKRLLEKREARQAYTLLIAQESARAGEPEYDYLLGIAANDAGEAERAVFALERVLAVQPAHHLARAEIARAYLALGEREAARREFRTVREQAIPAEAKANIDRLLAGIAAADVTRIQGFIELGLGYDTNVNAATGTGQIALPALGGIIATLDPAFTKRSDSFVQLSGGLNITHRLTDAWAIIGNAAAGMRSHSDQDRFDRFNLDGSLGVRWLGDRNAVTLAGQAQSFELDHDRYRETAGLLAQWQHSFTPRQQFSLFGQFAELRYPTQGIRNADREVVGAAYGGQARFGGGWSMLASLAHENRRYGGPEPIFLATRHDRQWDATVGLSYLVRPNTTVLAQLAYTDNRSNIPINEFDRMVSTLSLRFHF